MAPHKHQVLVYAATDPSGSSASTDALVHALKARLNPYYAVHRVAYAALQADPWEDQCAALIVVLDGGRETATSGQVGKIVRERVRRYLRAQGGNVVLSLTREGPVGDVFGVDDALGAVSVKRSAERSLVLENTESCPLQPLGVQPDADESGIRAAKISVASEGTLIVTTLSAFNLGNDPSETTTTTTTTTTTAILQACGIEIPHLPPRAAGGTISDESTPPPPRDVWTSVAPELLKPTRPLPQIMLINPDLERDALGWDIWTRKELDASRESRGLDSDPCAAIVLEDINDTLRVVQVSKDDDTAAAAAATRILESARSDARSESMTEFPREKTILCPNALTDALPAMPLFQADAYFTQLVRLGRVNGQRKRNNHGGGGGGGATSEDAWNIGDVVLYGEAVTSTQTMLDKNPKILRGLPTPFLSLATFQLSGRGRGSNQWLSPPGCLQFSLLLTLPPSFPADKLVFIQYLGALAICDGLDADGKLGVRIKWPNDIYAYAEGVGGTTVGSGQRGKAKLGGILVNSSLVDGRWRVVVGCGINVLNDLPTTSLAQLHELKARREALRSGESGGSGAGAQVEQVSMEKSLARILVAFEGFWGTFLRDRGFKGLLDEYLGRWLHSDQKVTLTSTTPPQALVIKTITLDYGLLRCVPDRSADSALSRSSMYDGGSEDRSFSLAHSLSAGMQALGMDRARSESFVDLQPDGNSFDLMSGLIKRKV